MRLIEPAMHAATMSMSGQELVSKADTNNLDTSDNAPNSLGFLRIVIYFGYWLAACMVQLYLQVHQIAFGLMNREQS